MGLPVRAHGSSCLQATGSWDSTIHIWDLRAGTPAISRQELNGHTGNISCLCYSAAGLLVSWGALCSGLAPCWLQDKLEGHGPFWGPVSTGPKQSCLPSRHLDPGTRPSTSGNPLPEACLSSSRATSPG